MIQNPSSQRVLKFIRGKTGHQPNPDRLRIQKELFGFQKEVKHGFPSKPTSLAYDNKLGLLAISTKSGGIRMYGKPGVEFYGEHEGEVQATQMLFLPGQGRIVTLTEDNFLHLWEINDKSFKEVKSTNLEGRLKKVSVLCLDQTQQVVLLGTEGGNIYHLNLTKFRVEETIIYQDIVMKGAPDDFKVNPGAVEALLTKPDDDSKILIGYARGLIVLWDRVNSLPLQTFVAQQQLESLAWRNDGSQFISAHNDGSYVIWSTQGNVVEPLEPPNTPYGPYPCKAITKIHWEHDNGNSWIVFNGGMPRASYGDKFTVSVLKNDEKHVVFDITSKIIDFLIIKNENSPESLVMLAEEELVVVDLQTDSWLPHSLPYLNPIHASAVTCITYASEVNKDVMVKLQNLNRGDMYSDSEWPIQGGEIGDEALHEKNAELLISGHEDGSVKIWTCGPTLALSHLATIKTNKYFEGDDLDEPSEEDDEDEWPPFKRIGHYDPYSDDPRLAVKKLHFSSETGRLVIGGTAGQVLVCDIITSNEDSESTKAIKTIKCDLVTEKEGFTWKGHQPLKVRGTEVKTDRASGFEVNFIIQISPPASLNSLGLSDTWDVLAAGTAHGLVLVDCAAKLAVQSKCTLNAQDIANADDNPMSRRKSLKKSLRESFRRLRKGRSQRNVEKNKRTNVPTDPVKKEMKSNHDYLSHHLDSSIKVIPVRPTRSSPNIKIVNRKPGAFVAPSTTSTLNMPPKVAKQVGYHWRKVRKCTLSSKRKNLVSVVRPVLMDLTKQISREEVGVQTESCYFVKEKTSEKLTKMMKLPEWYWSGHEGIPSHIRRPKLGAVSKSHSVLNTLKQNPAYNRISRSLSDMQTSLLKFGQEHFYMNNRNIHENLQHVDLDKIRSRYSRTGFRRTSIMDQIEAKQSSYTRNTIKKSVVNNLQKNLYKAEDSPFKRTSSIISKSSTVASFISWDTVTKESILLRRSPESFKAKVAEAEGMSTKPRPKLKLQRSLTLDSFVKPTEPKRMSLKISRKLSLMNDTDKDKKKMRKMWGETYTGMCNRAVVLNHAICQADKEEIAVKPVNTLKPHEDKPSDIAEKKDKKLFLGLSQQFYNLSNDNESDDEEMNLSTLMSTTPIDYYLPSVMSAKAKEIPETEEVILTATRNGQNVRLNLRTRSVEVLQSLAISSSDTISLDTPLYQSRKSVISTLSPSNIPRLKPKLDSTDDSDAPDYLDLDDTVLKVVDSRPHTKNVLDSINLLNSLLRSKSDVGVQANLNVSKQHSRLNRHLNRLFFGFSSARSESPESRPVERQIEARSGSEDGLGSMVRCLSFAKTYIANPNEMSHTLWAGTNSGQILVFLLHLPKTEDRKNNKKKVESMLGKEIQLKHKAPVISIEVINSNGVPVNKGEEAQVPHRVLIASEEQFKTFLLPTLKPSGKYKLTAHEGSRIRRIGFTKFVSKVNKETKEDCLTCLTNQGDLTIQSLPDLRRQAQTNCMKKEDLIAISSLVFTPRGEALFLCSSSELQRVSLAAAHIIAPPGFVKIDPKFREEVNKKEETSEQNESSVNKSAVPVATNLREKKPNPEVKSPSSDPHNDTTVSEISADITLDSVKDHTVSHANETVTTTEESSVTITKIETSQSGSSSVVKTTAVTSATQENTLTNGKAEVNGICEALVTSNINVTEPEVDSGNDIEDSEEAVAPLASMESTGIEYPSIVSTTTNDLQNV